MDELLPPQEANTTNEMPRNSLLNSFKKREISEAVHKTPLNPEVKLPHKVKINFYVTITSKQKRKALIQRPLAEPLDV